MEGHQVEGSPTRTRNRSDALPQLTTKEGVQALVIQHYPRHKFDPVQKLRAGRFRWVCYLHWTVNLSAADIAEELGLKTSQVQNDIAKAQEWATNKWTQNVNSTSSNELNEVGYAIKTSMGRHPEDDD
jgi:hypothetical protein